MRTSALAALLLPYLYFAFHDGVYHLRDRKVSIAEHLIHLALGAGALGVIAAVFTGRREPLFHSLPVLLGAGALDEFWFHKGLSERETDLHAKAHWALLIFVSLGLLWT